MYLMMPLTFTLLTKNPRLRPYCEPLGLFITVASLIMSSYATKVWQLIASQGVLCAIGSGLLFSPTTLYLDEWFIARKGMAYGVMWAGKAGQLELPSHSSCPHSSTISDREPLFKHGLSRWSFLQHLCYSFSSLESRCQILILKGHFLGHF